ncbi:MAG: hypothetical protein ABI333_16920 [bacterium]
MSAARALVVVIGVAVCAPAAAAEGGLKRWGELEGDVGFGFMGSDLFTTLQAGFDLQEGGFAMGLQLRLRLRVADGGDEHEGKGVRREDWDEPSDLAHILRYVSYRRKVKSVSVGLLLGEHAGYTLGYGTLIRDYSSAMDIDHPHSGVATRLSGRHWQLDFFLDDVVAPELTALRVLTRPIVGRHNLLVGATGVFDFRVPVAAVTDEDGARQVDSKRNLVVERGLLGAVGVDVGYLLGDGEENHLATYVTGNLLIPEKHRGDPAAGLHLGVRFGVRPFGGQLRVFGGVEYRRLGAGYMPSYVDLIYDVQRLQFPLTAQAASSAENAPTKLGAVVGGLAPAGNAWWGQLGVQYGRWFEASVHYEHRPGLLGQGLGARASVVVGRWFLASVLLEWFGMDAPDAERARGLLASAEARVRPTKRTYLLAQYSRLWHLSQTGLYRPLDQLNVAFGVAWGY